MNALWGLLAYVIFTQAVLGIRAYGNYEIRKEWKEGKFKMHFDALASWIFMMAGAEQDSVVASVFLWLLLFAWTSAQGVIASVAFGVLTLLFPMTIIFRVLGCLCKFSESKR